MTRAFHKSARKVLNVGSSWRFYVKWNLFEAVNDMAPPGGEANNKLAE